MRPCKSWKLIPRHWKYAEKRKAICELYEVNDGWKMKKQMPGQYHETVQKEKKTKEVLGLSFFLWKLEAERAKGDELEIEQVVNVM